VSGGPEQAGARLRLDKWLWQARFFKTRSLAQKTIMGGGVRVNGQRVVKTASSVAPGDTLTFLTGDWVRVIRVSALGNRRGPAPEAQALYDDLSEPRPALPSPETSPPGAGEAGRPSGAERRARARFTGEA